jgi:hypothetical protein
MLLKFITELKQHEVAIIKTLDKNETYRRLIMNNDFHQLADKDRKMVNNTLRLAIAQHIAWTADAIESAVIQLHGATTVGVVSTTESDLYDVFYKFDLDDLATQLT